MQNRAATRLESAATESKEPSRGILGGRACLGTGQHRGGEDLLQDLRYLFGVHGDKRAACWQGSLEPMCQRK